MRSEHAVGPLARRIFEASEQGLGLLEARGLVEQSTIGSYQGRGLVKGCVHLPQAARKQQYQFVLAVRPAY